jgi:hypothetical protein
MHSTHTQGTIPSMSQSPSVSTGSQGVSDHSDRLRAAQIKEQKELQLLETRIREAAVQSAMGKGVGSVGGQTGLPHGDKGLRQLEELNKERESEYRILASRYNESDEKDTIDDAERNRGDAAPLTLIQPCCVCLAIAIMHRTDAEHPDFSLYRSALLCAALYCFVLFSSVLFCPMYSSLFYSILLFYSTLFYSILLYSYLLRHALKCY